MENLHHVYFTTIFPPPQPQNFFKKETKRETRQTRKQSEKKLNKWLNKTVYNCIGNFQGTIFCISHILIMLLKFKKHLKKWRGKKKEEKHFSQDQHHWKISVQPPARFGVH